MRVTILVSVDVAVLAASGIAFALEVGYRRVIPDDADRAAAVPASIRLPLDDTLGPEVVIDDVAEGRIEISVLGIDGSSLSRSFVPAEPTTRVDLDAALLVKTARAAQAVPSDTIPPQVSRSARLVPTGGAPIDFVRSTAAVLPLANQAALDAIALPRLGAGQKRVSTIEVTADDAAALGALALLPARVGIDGMLTATFPGSTSIGWLWLLSGPHRVVGFIPDDLSEPEASTAVVPLPVLSQPPEDAAVPAGPVRSVPADVSETELADNPDMFTEDPGTYCRPFSNPERIIGEEAFSVIARITQPDISPTPSRRTKLLSILSLEPMFEEETPPRVSLFRRAAAAVVPRRIDAAALASMNAGLFPTRVKPPKQWDDLVVALPSGRTNLDAEHPLQWEDDIAQYQAATIALGHILEFRMRWRSNGYSLGTVASTLTLAPRQTRRIQKIEWERRERALRRETTALRDEVEDSVVRERDYTDEVSANLSEWARGSSTATTKSIAGGIGFFAKGVLGGIGGGASSARSTSQTSGGRDTTASEQQRLRDAIRRHGDALRKLESTVVTEVSQEETVTGTTEIIRNANYEHSLTVIYYQILRHLRVTTEFAGVRECLFVPFAIKPFDVYRAFRWRESLERSMRSPIYARGLRHLKDVASNFTTSDIPPGARAAQRLTFLRGSIYVNLGVERPRDASSGAFDALLWNVAQPFLESPALGVFSFLRSASAASRDQLFQAQYAPTMAARWADTMTLEVGGRPLAADFTLASRYQFNRGVRVDFAVPSSALAGLSRESLQELTVKGQALTPGSVANMTRMSIVYSTDRFEHGVEGRSGVADLVAPATGAAGVATASLPLDSWERVDERAEIKSAVRQLIEHLNEHVEHYTKAVMWGMDRDRLLMMLDGFYVPDTDNVAVASVVDREPVGIIGNSLVYRVGAASFLGYGKVTTPADLYNLYAEKKPMTDPLDIALPTEGLYAQAIMDECGALEEHYGSTDWVLDNPEPQLGDIDPSLLTSRRAEPSELLSPTPFPTSIINLQNAPDAPDPAGVAGALAAVQNAGAFRDMAGLAGTQSNAISALNTAADLAKNFGNQAAALQMAKLEKAKEATKTADKKIATIERAVNKGLATKEAAAEPTKRVLDSLTDDAPPSVPPHENAAVTSAVSAAKDVPGSTIEATTADGAVKVSMGDARDATGGQSGFFGLRGLVVGEATLRQAVADSARAELRRWRVGMGPLIKEDQDSQFGVLVGYWLSANPLLHPDTLLHLESLARSLSAAEFGDLLRETASAAQVDAAVAAVRSRLLSGVPSDHGAAELSTAIDAALRSARSSRLDTPQTGPWSAVFVSACVRAATIALGIEGNDVVAGEHVGTDVLRYSSAHRVYVLDAHRTRLESNRSQGKYTAFPPTAVAPNAGDIVVQDRRITIDIDDVVAFDDIPTVLQSDFPLHGDIVLGAPAGGFAAAIGGNIDGSVRVRHFPVDANSRLVVAREQLYATMDDSGAVSTLPRTDSAAGLDAESTGRIIALLRPTPARRS